MKHLIISREYPPAPGGGIGAYVLHISRLLAESGETVHVISQLWKGAEKEIEEMCQGRLVIHRVPFEDWTSFWGHKPSPALKSREAISLFNSSFYPQCFSWQASLLAERLVEQEGIDLIEAQEYEAPLYYFQLRRALGLGPKRQPPCFVHLHSPTEFIARHNDWDMGLPANLTAKRLEDYSIRAADTLLCPSRYLARQIEARYELPTNSIRVIPLPMGDFSVLERDQETWTRGAICYIGRLERRKGVLEWIDAAVAVAREFPTAYFEFVGENILGADRISSEELLKRRIPADLKERFHFRGQQKRSSLPQFLAQSRIAVVPSRWENFPNTCIEAMASGLPVIVSPEGGMAEMIKDGRSGWLAASSRSEDLAATLRRALETPASQIAEMGHQAGGDIREMCDNQKIRQDHLDFRMQLVRQGAKRSLRLPVNLPGPNTPLSWESVRCAPLDTPQHGLAIVITGVDSRQSLGKCIESIKQQTQKPAAVVVVVNDGRVAKQGLQLLSQVLAQGVQVVHPASGGMVSARNAGIEAILNSGLKPLGFVFLDVRDYLQPGFTSVCQSVLLQCPNVGLVSCWTESLDTNRVLIKPCPGFPYQWLSNEVAPLSAVRTEALSEAGNFRPAMSQGYEDWDLFNAVMAAGWAAVTVPEILARCRPEDDFVSNFTGTQAYGRMRAELLGRFPELLARDAQEIALLVGPYTTRLLDQQYLTVWRRLQLIRRLLNPPSRAVLAAFWALGQARKKLFQSVAFHTLNLISRTRGNAHG